MSSNPFEKLNVKRDDDDDEQEEFQQVKGKEKHVPYGLENKKNKVRPKEKQANKEGEEDFQEVKKVVKKRPPKQEEGEEDKEHKKRTGINFNTNEKREYRESKNPKPQRGRKFDKQSGTGRGKEVSKGGAGGKGTWGDNPKNIARDEDNYDDIYFQQALNQVPEEEKEKRKGKKKEEGEENKEDKKEEKRKGEKREKKELPPELKLDKPKDAISLEEYLKGKEQPKEEENKEVKRNDVGEPLKKTEEKKEEILGTSGPGKKKGKKKKNKEMDQEEFELNMKLGNKLDIGEEDKRRRQRKGKFKKEDEAFTYKKEEYPELK